MSDRPHPPDRDESGNRLYTDAYKASALTYLASRGGNVRRAAAELGVPERTLGYWAANPLAGAVRVNRRIAAELLEQALAKLQWRALRAAKRGTRGAKLSSVVTLMRELREGLRELRADNAAALPETTEGLDLSRLSTEQLRQFQALAAIAAGTEPQPRIVRVSGELVDSGVRVASEPLNSGGPGVADEAGRLNAPGVSGSANSNDSGVAPSSDDLTEDPLA